MAWPRSRGAATGSYERTRRRVSRFFAFSTARELATVSAPLWSRATDRDGIGVVGVADLVRLKMTRRARDYPIIGALAQSAGRNANCPDLALRYLWDYDELAQAVRTWPDEASACDRPAVDLLLRGAGRSDVVAALAQEQDEAMREDRARIDRLLKAMSDYGRRFAELKRRWQENEEPLESQHEALLSLATDLL